MPSDGLFLNSAPIPPAYASLSDLAAATVPNGYQRLRVDGFAAAGDGGAAHYSRVDTQPSHPGYVQSADGAYWEIDELIISAKMFGAKGDADPVNFTGTLDQAAINNAIACAAALAPAGGQAKVILPLGNYLIGISFGATGVAMVSNVQLSGDGARLLLANDTVAHIIDCQEISNFVIDGIETDCDPTTQPGNGQTTNETHGIRINSCSDYVVRYCRIKNTVAFGITNDIVHGGRILFCKTENTGADGIDFHNSNLDNDDLLVFGCVVDGFALRQTDAKCGIHGRGQIRISHCTVKNAGDATTGVNGIGCGNGESIEGQTIESCLVDLGVSGNGVTGVGTNNPNSVVKNCIVQANSSYLDAFDINGAQNLVEGCQALGAASRHGFNLNSAGTGAALTQIKNCIANGVDGNGFNIADVCDLVGNAAVSCSGYALAVTAGSNGTTVTRHRDSGCALGRKQDLGVGTIDYDTIVPSENAFGVASRLGLAKDLMLCLDAGDGACYPGSGQTVSDLTANATNFNLGATSGGEASDMTFAGTVGNRSSNEYFAGNGSQYLTLAAANPSWVNAMHQAGAQWAAAFWVKFGSLTASQALFGTNGSSASGIGIEVLVGATKFSVQVRNGSSTIVNLGNSALLPVAGAWTFLAVSFDAVTGPGGLILCKNNTVGAALDATLTSPSASNASYTIQIAAAGNATDIVANGFELGEAWLWAGTRSGTDFIALFNATRARFGV